MKKAYCLFLFSIIFTLTSCDTVIVGHRCIVYKSIYAENDDYIVFPEVVYNKKTDEFYTAMTLDDKYYSPGEVKEIEITKDKYNIYAVNKTSTFSYDGKMISEESISNESSYEYKYSLIEDGFYSSYQMIDADKEELSEIEEEIWNYAKTQSLKKEFPYHIEGECEKRDSYIYFNVNVYDKVMWKGQSLVNQGAKRATLNRINEDTKEIEEVLSFDNSVIKCFNDEYIFLYNKKNNSVDYYSLATKEQKTISKSDDWYFFYVTDKYVLRIYKHSINFNYEIFTLD